MLNSKVSLVLGDDLDQVNKVIALEGLNPDNAAPITNPDYLDYLTLVPDETIYIAGWSSTEMLQAIQDKIKADIKPGKSVHLQIVMPETACPDFA